MSRTTGFSQSGLLWHLLALVSGVLTFSGAASSDSGLRTQDFSTDPGWEGYRNRLMAGKERTARQDFGYSTTQHAGGEQPGEIGGWIQRSLTMARYGMPLERVYTMDDRLDLTYSATGPIATPN